MPYNIKYFRGNVHVFLHIFVYYVLMENFDSAVVIYPRSFIKKDMAFLTKQFESFLNNLGIVFKVMINLWKILILIVMHNSSISPCR
uniref:Predicted orf n=1 Tax=Kuenenia stuttgartiensis TaxID=174633 RepID=Q1Q718_KUEST|nr:predicted orf [Candidatus Kuenenia stuttgartiensis]